MTILSLDTTSNFASVAIRSQGRTLSEIGLESTDGFAHLIFAAIENCKNEAKLDLTDIDAFAATAGPGSFTGLRVGLSAIKGLSESMGKPAIAISNLKVLSSFGKKPGSFRATLLDARRDQVYAAVYDADLRPVFPETVLPLAAWLAGLDPQQDYEFISFVPLADRPVIVPPRFLAAAAALCAEREGLWLDPAALDANYVRRSDAELFWRED